MAICQTNNTKLSSIDSPFPPSQHSFITVSECIPKKRPQTTPWKVGSENYKSRKLLTWNWTVFSQQVIENKNETVRTVALQMGRLSFGSGDGVTNVSFNEETVVESPPYWTFQA